MGTITCKSLRVLGLLILVAAAWPDPARGAGPWRGQIVDAETGKPLEGVVVLMYWIKYTSSVGGWAGAEFYDSEEVVTDPEGNFLIPARSTVTILPWKKISRELVIFKPGYGRWRFQGSTDWPTDVVHRKPYVQKAWKQFEGEGVVIELPPLKTRKERLQFYGTFSWSLVPPERTKRLRQEEDQERAYLGFQKMHEGK